jgi:choice-of-anchor B domain-containing protein
MMLLRILGMVTVLSAGLATAAGASHEGHEPPGQPIGGSGYSGGEPISPGSSGAALEFPARKVALLSWLTSEELSGRAQPANDIWGYVSPSGREYAVIGLQRGTAVVEVTDPLRPTVVSFARGPSSFWRDIKTYGEFAYVTNETKRGVQVLDLREVDAGRVRRRGYVRDFGLATAHNLALDPASGWAYLAGSNLSGGGLVAMDLADPRRPRLPAGARWPDHYVHDMLAVTYTSGPYAGREIVFAFSGFDGIDILDVTDKANIVRLSNLVYPGLGYCHSGALHRDGTTLYVNDEGDEIRDLAENATTYVVDVSRLEEPRFLRAVDSGRPSIDHNSMVQGRFLLGAQYAAGLRVFRAQPARQPRQTGWFDTHPEDDERTFSGAWGVHSELPSGTILISDIERGLFALALE